MSTKLLGILDQLRAGTINKVAVLTGAGVSVAAGIPDFRSPGGMYDTLRPELLTATEWERDILRDNPTAVVDIRIFERNQFPYLEVRRPFILGTAEVKWKPTLSHFFFRLLAEKGVLRRLYTQNIDGLDFHTGIPEEKIVGVHGTIAKAGCEFCGYPMPYEEFRRAVRQKIRNIYDSFDPEAPKESTNILCLKCHKPGVKPTTVLYGRNLPDQTWTKATDDFPENVDLMIIAGTSLGVYPVCDFVNRVRDGTPRILVNLEKVGENLGLDFDSEDSNDVFLQGSCDDGFLSIAKHCGWLEDLAIYKDSMCPASAGALIDALTTRK